MLLAPSPWLSWALGNTLTCRQADHDVESDDAAAMMMMILTMTLMMLVVITMGEGINLSPILAKLHTRPHLGP